MHLQSHITVPQDIEHVSKFFFEPSNLPKWDRSVASVVPTSSVAGVGSSFDTIAPSGMKMSYRVTELEYGRSTKIALSNSKMFKKALWHFQFDPESKGTKITCHVYFKLRAGYFLLAPILYLNRNALFRDLTFLKDALEESD